MGCRADRFRSAGHDDPPDQSGPGDRTSGICREAGGMGSLEMGRRSRVLATHRVEREGRIETPRHLPDGQKPPGISRRFSASGPRTQNRSRVPMPALLSFASAPPGIGSEL